MSDNDKPERKPPAKRLSWTAKALIAICLYAVSSGPTYAIVYWVAFGQIPIWRTAYAPILKFTEVAGLADPFLHWLTWWTELRYVLWPP